MFAENLRQKLIVLSKRYAVKHETPSCKSEKGVVVFKRYSDGLGNFLNSSYKNILSKESWKKRLMKPHAFFPVNSEIHELDSCNSSDALLMNIFCNPELNKWKSLKELLKLPAPYEPEFGLKAKVKKNGKGDDTEIDMKINNVIFEAKLTEPDFTKKEKAIVESYDKFAEIFNKSSLDQKNKFYMNYQLIRNILAAYQHNFSFCLLCDGRRPDLVREFYKTVRCIKEQSLRSRCNIIFWQEIAMNVGKELHDFLSEKYGF